MIEITWHLLLMIVITVFLLIGIFKSEGGLDFTPLFCVVGLAILWAVYGGVFFW